MPTARKKTPGVNAQIRAMVRRIVDRFGPEQVILFGSHARGQAGPDSDVDLLVVMEVEGSKRLQRLQIRMALHDFRVAKDILLASPREFAWRKDALGTMEQPAFQEGKVLYARR